MYLRRLFFLLTIGLTVNLASGAEVGSEREAQFEPQVSGPSDEGINAIPTFEVADGLVVELVAAEPHLANPVAFTIDEQGRFYVAETFRHGQGVLDIRGRARWPSEEFRSRLSPERLANLGEELLDVDLAVRTVDDRIAYLRRYMGDEVEQLARATERVRRLVDLNGDGMVDQSTVFADGFRNIADGIGAGVLARKGQVFYANIPDLWAFTDYDQDGVPEKSQSLHYGYGVRTGFLGHDLHGLVMGPDGKLYFSIGDRGTHVETFDGRVISVPDTGAVFRCYPDGTKLEVFSTGLRNPQELAFDEFGNLFTGDNNSDGGDQARWVYLVEGGDSGWRIGYQFIQQPTRRGPWNAEKLWYPRFPGQASYLIPPLANIGNGPSGLAYYPGLGLSDDYNGAFLMVDFRGAKNTSGIHRIKVKPSGAGYEVDELDRIVWQTAATDVGFGYDGGVYFTDWVGGWDTPGKGRLYRIADPVRRNDPRVLAVKSLMAGGFEKQEQGALRALLGHPDMRVRLEAQYELADRGLDSLATFAKVFEVQANLLPRLHAVWGIAQTIDRAGAGSDQQLLSERVAPLLTQLETTDGELKAQICKVLGDLKVASAVPQLIEALGDESARVRYFAALSLGKLGQGAAIQPLLQLAAANADEDVYIRHAVVMALVGINDLPAILSAADSSDVAVARVSLLALRRLERPEIARFLNHSDLELVREAALAINDVPIDAATIDLAALVEREGLDDATLQRVLNANYRLGNYESARALAVYASRDGGVESLRREALDALSEWEGPLGRDRVTGVWRPLLTRGRDNVIAAKAIVEIMPALLNSDSEAVRRGALNLVGVLELNEFQDVLLEVASSESESRQVRVQALTALKELDLKLFKAAVTPVLSTEKGRLRTEALRLAVGVVGLNVFTLAEHFLANGSVEQRQQALVSVQSLKDSRVPGLLSGLLEKANRNDVAPEILLELIEAAEQVDDEGVASKLSAFRSRLPQEKSAARHPELLQGGNAGLGRQVFLEKLEVSCSRCHKLDGVGGEAGPDLNGVGGRQTAAYLLESILYPNLAVAEGFETTVLDLGDNIAVGGIIKEENDDEVVIITQEDGEMTLAKSDIVGRSRGPSAMPEELSSLLTAREIRDLVAFLTSLK